MMMDESHRAKLRKHGTLIGRVLMGLLFFSSGLDILFVSGVGNTATYFANLGIPLAGLVVWVVLAIKFGAGGALMLGYRSGWAASLLILFTGSTILVAHLDPNDINLFKNFAIIGGLLYVMAYGPGEGWKLETDETEEEPASTPNQPETFTSSPPQSGQPM